VLNPHITPEHAAPLIRQCGEGTPDNKEQNIYDYQQIISTPNSFNQDKHDMVTVKPGLAHCKAASSYVQANL